MNEKYQSLSNFNPQCTKGKNNPMLVKSDVDRGAKSLRWRVKWLLNFLIKANQISAHKNDDF